MVKKKGDVIALDIGGTNMRIALVRSGKIIDVMKFPTPKTKKDFLERLVVMIDMYYSSKIRGIGIGVAGPVFGGKLLDTNNLPVKRYDLKSFLEKKFKTKVGVANDVDCFALSEVHSGSSAKNLIYVAIGTGIGGGIVIDSKLYSGTGYAGEFGMMMNDGKTWEDQWRLIKKRINKNFKKGTYFSDITSMNSSKAKKITSDAAKIFGQGIGSLVSIFDPEKVFIDGGIRASGNSFLKLVQKETNNNIPYKNYKKLRWGSHKEPGLIGASYLV